MSKPILYLALLSSGFTLSNTDNADALLQIAMTGNYVFDNNVELAIRVTDTKEVAPTDDPLNHLVFSLNFKDKVDGKQIALLQGRLYKKGGIEALETEYPRDFNYISKKLDFYGALDNEYDFFDVVETRYDTSKIEEIKELLSSQKVLNQLRSYRVQEKVMPVPKTVDDTDRTPDEIKIALLKSNPYPNYLFATNVNDLTIMEAMLTVMAKLNIHLFFDVGDLKDWKQVVALVEALNLDDQRVRVLWSPNKARPMNATTVLARKKWRPCVGDYVAKHLLRNALTDNNGIPPLHIPVGGYDFPLRFKGMQQFDDVVLDEEAQNALAEAKVIVVLNERYQNETRWVYGDVLTQYDSKNSALRLANSSEIETYTANGVINIIKRHMLKGMSDYIESATADCNKFLENCVARGLLKPSSQLGGRYFSLSITPRADKPFEAVDVKFGRRAEGAVRQAYLETTINK